MALLHTLSCLLWVAVVRLQMCATYKRPSLLVLKWDQHYSLTLEWMRCKLFFAFFRSAVQYICRAHSGGGQAFKQASVPADLIMMETNNTSYQTMSFLVCKYPLILYHSTYLLFFFVMNVFIVHSLALLLYAFFIMTKIVAK